MKTNVENMTSHNGNTVPNQFIITESNGDVYFKSYSSIIAVQRNNGKIELDEKFWDYSQTTGKYRNQFLGETKAETQKKIDAGIYLLVDLN
jgi:hypothetical protein